MDPTKLAQTTEKLLRTSRVFEKYARHADESDRLSTAVAIIVLGIISFFMLFFVTSHMFTETAEALNSNTLWAWPLVAVLVSLALVLSVCAALKFFAV